MSSSSRVSHCEEAADVQQRSTQGKKAAVAAAAENDDELLTVISSSPPPSDVELAARRSGGSGARSSIKRPRSENESSKQPANEVVMKKKAALQFGSVNGNNGQAKLDQSGNDARIQKMAGACKIILECIGEDPEREGLRKTPERWAKALQFMCSGYQLTPDAVTNGAVFEENHDEMVVVRNIDIHSLCEHHMLPFTGRVHIGYIPAGKILGLSKLARIAELYARRLQVQERLTRQIADAVVDTVEPLGVAVVVECTHFCMVMRGVQKTATVTTTSSVRGCFESNPKTRAEFFSIIHGGGIKMC